jgi:hypothetical protein
MTTPIYERLQRKVQQIRNRLINLDQDDVRLLVDLMQRSPSGRDDVQKWAEEFSHLLRKNLLKRVSQKDLSLILAGLVSYRNTGVTPLATQGALVRGYESSDGILQELLHKTLFSAGFEIEPIVDSIFFGETNRSQLDSIIKELEDNGYVILPVKLSSEWIESFTLEAKKFSYKLRNETISQFEPESCQVNPNRPPKCVAAYADSSQLKASPIFNRFCNDPMLLNLASRYMNATVSAIDSTLWYSFPSNQPSAEAAQLFHYDLDTLRWLKVFVYLTDVGPDSGPHEYVVASHKCGNKPRPLRERGYARIQDSEIDMFFPERRQTICGSRGTVILGDTRCFHKGNAVKNGYRLIYSPIFSPSTIGYHHGS